MKEFENGCYTTFPPTQAELQTANQIVAVFKAYGTVSPSGITAPSEYYVRRRRRTTYDSSTDGTYSFSSSTAIETLSLGD